jgi:hypothetical protein
MIAVVCSTQGVGVSCVLSVALHVGESCTAVHQLQVCWPMCSPGPCGAVLHILEEHVVLAIVVQRAVGVVHLQSSCVATATTSNEGSEASTRLC